MHRKPRLSLALLRGFRAAARHLSFTRAAQELFVTQSASSHEIKALEERIGQPLFHRVHRALQLTEVGEQPYRAADETLTQLDAVVERLTDPGGLTVTTTTALASLWLASRLPRFNRLHPGIDVRIIAWLRSEVSRDADLTLALSSKLDRPSARHAHEPVGRT